MVELVILLFVVLAVACFGLLLPFLRLAVGIVLLAVRLLASLARSMSFEPKKSGSMMLDVPVPRVPMLRARLQDSRRGGAA